MDPNSKGGAARGSPAGAEIERACPPKPWRRRVCHLLIGNLVEKAAPASVIIVSDISFVCDHCASPLVVDAAAKGMTLPCQRCGRPTKVPERSRPAPKVSPAPEPEARVAELRRQLKENESQRTEITGYINQLSIQLHRWQLRLQTLNERKQQLETELSASK